MPRISIRTRDGGERTLATAPLDRLATDLRGEVVFQSDPQYEDMRRIWNRMIERRPAMIVRCRSASDVLHAVRFAREHDLLISVRGGGHNIAGNALADAGLLVDLSPMRGVRVDPARRTARVEPGVTLGEVDHETQTFGLATPLGINSTTGVAGLTLGGGYGWLSRSLGLTVDNLVSVDVITADGALLTASETEHSDLFWAIRGGGGNFGIVTSFEYRLQPVGPEVYAGLIIHPFDEAARLLRRYRDVALAAPDQLAIWSVLRKAPPLPVLPESVHGREVVVLAVCWAGDAAEGDQALQALRAIGTPHADIAGRVPYAAFQQTFDGLLATGLRNYWKSHNLATLPDELIDVLVDQASRLPGPMTEIVLAQLGGAVSRRPDDATAYAGRASRWVMNVHGRWEDQDADETFIGWARGLHEATRPFAAADGAYVNFMTHDEQARVREAYGANYDRLAMIKAKYDPTNFFRVNQNIVPAVPAEAPAGAFQANPVRS